MDSIGFGLLMIVIAAMGLELLWSTIRKKRVYSFKESLANLAILIGNNLLKPLSLAWKFLIFSLVEPFRIFDIPTNLWTVALTFFVTEFAYYWYHRLSHEIAFLWSIHHTHHSSRWMNLTTAVRLNWLGSFVSVIFFVPFILLGFSPEVVVLCLALGLFYQFFLHTEAIGRLGPLEGLFLNTPSAHRVHHGSNPKYIDKNYGAVLIVYDRLFGTYQPEEERVEYGVTTGSVGYNPFKIVLLPVIRYFRADLKREMDSISSKAPKSGPTQPLEPAETSPDNEVPGAIDQDDGAQIR